MKTLVKLYALAYAHFNPEWYNKLLAAEYRRRAPDLLVKYGFDIASTVIIAASEIEKAKTAAERKNIERNLREIIQETLGK